MIVKNIFEIPPRAHHVIFITEFVLLIKLLFSVRQIHLIENGLRMKEFQNDFFSRPLFIIIFRPKILFFVTYSILTG